MKSRVVLVECREYDPEKVYGALKEGLALLGGIEAFVSKDEKILLKPNLLNRAAPEKCVSTHPAVFGAVGRILREEGYPNLTYGDSPGPPQFWQQVAKICGISQSMEPYEIPPGNFEESVLIENPEGSIARNFDICKGVAESDAILNVCKMKTHQLTRITGAIKNSFGCVYGMNKSAFHARFPLVKDFSRMLVDLNLYLKPRLHIMDGVIAMEGNGPGSGNPTSMGVILLSADQVALDSVFCRLINLDPQLVHPIKIGEELGLGKWRDEDIEVVIPGSAGTLDELLEPYKKPNFDVFRDDIPMWKWKMLSFFGGFVERRPHIINKRCVRCGACVEACPLDPKAVEFVNGKDNPPQYDHKHCIRCFCCQEMCPAKAIEARTHPLGRLVMGRKKTGG